MTRVMTRDNVSGLQAMIRNTLLALLLRVCVQPDFARPTDVVVSEEARNSMSWLVSIWLCTDFVP